MKRIWSYMSFFLSYYQVIRILHCQAFSLYLSEIKPDVELEDKHILTEFVILK